MTQKARTFQKTEEYARIYLGLLCMEQSLYVHGVHGKMGWKQEAGFDSETGWFSNAFTAKGQDELLAVSFSMVDLDSTCRPVLYPHRMFALRLLLAWSFTSSSLRAAGWWLLDQPWRVSRSEQTALINPLRYGCLSLEKKQVERNHENEMSCQSCTGFTI